MNELERIADRLTGASREVQRGRRMAIGVGLAGGLFVAIAAYILTGNGWWFVLPPLCLVVAWRVVLGCWPFSRDPR